MNARSRQARRTITQRSASTRAAARIKRRGDATLTSHCIAAGLTPREARSVAGSLRSAARGLEMTGREVDMQVKWRIHSRKTGLVTARLFTVTEVALIATKYAPRKPQYRTARQHLLSLAA